MPAGGMFDSTQSHQKILRRQLGRRDNPDGDQLEVDEGLLYDLRMGYYHHETIKPHSPIAYYPEENDFYHPWSLQSTGEEYGYGRLEEIIPLKEYLTLPNVVIENVLKGVIKGRDKKLGEDREREKTTERNLNEQARKAGLSLEDYQALKKSGAIK